VEVKALLRELEDPKLEYDLWIKIRGKQVDVHVVAQALLQYLRSLTEPLMKYSLYDKWIQVSQIEKAFQRKAFVSHLMEDLSVLEQLVLKHTFKCLHRIYKNSDTTKMRPENLAPIWSGILLRLVCQSI